MEELRAVVTALKDAGGQGGPLLRVPRPPGLFRLNLPKLPTVSKFYDADCYENKLWVKHSGNEITFEETLDDFASFDDNIITQVIHFEYSENNSKYYITHIDHEYIFYSCDEYLKRCNDSTIHGHCKIKTFKIDKSTIPIDFRYDGNYFLYLALDAYFINKNLIEEYFNGMN